MKKEKRHTQRERERSEKERKEKKDAERDRDSQSERERDPCQLLKSHKSNTLHYRCLLLSIALYTPAHFCSMAFCLARFC